MVWPALWNGYPLLFSDTGALMEMSLEPTMGWDKPWIYGPFLHLFHWRQTLWLPLAAQGLIVSHLLWLTQAVFTGRSPLRHAGLCALLAAGSAAPWFTALLMPDLFTAVTVLCLFLLGFGPGRLTRAELAWAGGIGAVAIASHLAHLILAASCVGAIGLIGRRIPWRSAAPLGVALGLLLLTNWVGMGRFGISPNGSVFALARLIGDGPGRVYIDQACPGAGLKLCAWRGRLAADSDAFLWHPQGPLWDRSLWGDAFGPVALAPEAARLVPAIIAAYPLETLRAVASNTLQQLVMVRVGDALGPDALAEAVMPKLRLYFPAAEVARFEAGRQARGLLRDAARPFGPLHLGLLLAGGAGTAWVVVMGWRDRGKDRALAGFAALVLTALLANAFSTGALSGPHDRYQARIAWLVLLPPWFYAARRETSSGDIRTSAS